jgi:predicted  nucleic acid-binding Zn-ribbon protein
MDHPTAGCGHVFLDGAEHTIIKMPKSCGKGPYARIASLAAHPNQNVLSAVHQSVKPASEQVYQLRFDYRELCQCVSWFSR